MKTWEMIKMLTENPKLKATDGNRVVYIGNNHHKAGLFIEKNSGKPEKYGDVFYPAIMNCIDVDWQIVRQPVPAWEAVKAYCEGKKVSFVVPCGDEYFLQDGLITQPKRYKEAVWYIND